MDYSLIATIASAILVTAAAALGVKYRRLKGKADKIKNLIAYLVNVWEDDELTPEEIEGLVERAKVLLEPEDEV